MNSLYLKLGVIVLIFAGEALGIYAEMIGARNHSLLAQSFSYSFFRAFLVFAVAGVFLVAGYSLGLKSFQNIWIVSVVSITSVLIIEPILAYTLFHQVPTKGALIGLILGAAGFLAAIFF